MRTKKLGKKVTDFVDREKEVFEIYTKLNKSNQHKMLQIPVCKIPKTFN